VGDFFGRPNPGCRALLGGAQIPLVLFFQLLLRTIFYRAFSIRHKTPRDFAIYIRYEESCSSRNLTSNIACNIPSAPASGADFLSEPSLLAHLQCPVGINETVKMD